MSTGVPALDAFDRATEAVEAILGEARELAVIVANGAVALEQNPAKWGFDDHDPLTGITAHPSRRDRRENFSIPPDDALLNPINVARWPTVASLQDLQRRYQSAIAAERAAFNAIPAALRARLSIKGR